MKNVSPEKTRVTEINRKQKGENIPGQPLPTNQLPPIPGNTTIRQPAILKTIFLASKIDCKSLKEVVREDTNHGARC